MHRELEAQYNEDIGAVDLFQICYVVEGPDADAGPRDHQGATAKEHGLEAELGDELLFQIFYRAEDADKRRASRRRSTATCSTSRTPSSSSAASPRRPPSR